MDEYTAPLIASGSACTGASPPNERTLTNELSRIHEMACINLSRVRSLGEKLNGSSPEVRGEKAPTPAGLMGTLAKIADALSEEGAVLARLENTIGEGA